MRLPINAVMLKLIIYAHTNVLVLTCIRRCHALLHSRGINKEFERRTRLTHWAYLIVLPRFKIDIAHIGTYIACLRFHSHEASMHKLDHILKRIDGWHRFHYWTIIAKEFYFVGLIQIVIYRIRIVRETRLQHFVSVSLTYLIFNKTRYFIALCVAPRIAHAAPVCIEVALNRLHLVMHSLFGISLHTWVERSINL